MAIRAHYQNYLFHLSNRKAQLNGYLDLRRSVSACEHCPPTRYRIIFIDIYLKLIDWVWCSKEILTLGSDYMR